MKDLWLISEAGWQGYLARMIHKETQVKALQAINPFRLEDREKLMSVVAANSKMKVWDDEDDEDDERGPSPYTVEGAYHYMVQVTDNVAVLRISGTLTNDYHWWNRIFDEVSYPEIISSANHLQKLQEAGQIDTVILAFDTPGGAVHGIETAANALENLGKSVKLISHAETQMTSGGVWLGVSAKHISANRMAVVASIGVIAVHMSYHRMLKEMGIDATVLRSGEEKALGSRYEPYTAKAEAVMQESMDIVHNEFKTRVAAGRNLSSSQVEAISTGRSWMAFQPEVSTLVDEITTLDAVVAKHLTVHNPRNSASNFNLSAVQIIGEGAGTMKVKVLNAKGQAAVASGLAAEEAFKDATMYEERDATQAEEEVNKDKDVKDDDKGKDGKDVKEDDQNKDDKEGKDVKEGKGGDKVVKDDDSLHSRLEAALKANGRLEAKIEQLETQIADGKAALELAATSAASLESIALSATNKMEVALGTSTSDSSLKGAALVSRHAAVTERFEKTFVTGPKATVPADKDLSARGSLDDETVEFNRRLAAKK